MFMSLVVHVVEFLLMSLVGIMLYKLYSSYKSWKESSAFSVVRSSQNVRQRISSFNEPISAKVNVTQVHVRLTKSSVSSAASVPVVPVLKPKVVQEELKSTPSESLSIQCSPEKTKTSILDDYIGEFFAGTPKMELEPYRAQVTEVVPVSKSSYVAAEQEDEVISVEMVQPIVDSRDTSLVHVLASHESEDNIPTLDDFSDVDPEAYITVISNVDEVKHGNKVMSDKVVLAMLDEAKLVCAS